MNVKKYVDSLPVTNKHTIAITGATSGIGKALFYHLINKDVDIILLVRNLDKGNALKNEFPNKKIDVIEYDQSSFNKIEKACDELVNKYPKLDTIVLDAGNLGEKAPTEDGYPGTIGVNYFGVRHFIDYISPKLKGNVRFVIQGSIVGGLKPKKNASLLDIHLKMFDQYNLSKIYLEAYFYKLFTEKHYANIEYVLTEPGISGTNIIRNMNGFIRFNGKWFLKLFFHSPKKASLTLLTGVSDIAKNGDYIVPRGLFTMGGYPKIKEFPSKRRREYLFEKEKSPN